MLVDSKNFGLFLTVEGGEGAGKTTNIKTICDFLSANNIDYIVTREPGGTDLAEQIRELLLAPREESVAVKTELLLMFAARAQHLENKILPALTAGQWVVCDRFTDATFAYQGGGREMGMELISQLETIVQEDLQPDCTFLLDLPIEIGMQRASLRGDLDRFEQEKLSFFKRVRATYLMRAEQDVNRFKIIDASKDISVVARQLQSELQLLLDARLSANE
jgi:dTMP kinase|tara:strand:- start:2904 stop:3563 length:660 start_codon:yes stop_codon:yes gene_type:complete